MDGVPTGWLELAGLSSPVWEAQLGSCGMGVGVGVAPAGS